MSPLEGNPRPSRAGRSQKGRALLNSRRLLFLHALSGVDRGETLHSPQPTTLADFSVSYFGFDYTGIQMTEEATVNGITGTIGQLNHVSITMVSRNFQVLATPSTLSYDGTSFSVTYGGP